jgi:hypothetical protein
MSVPNETSQPTRPESKGNAQELLKLVERWLAEDDGYDASAWPVVAQEIEENRLSGRKRVQGQTHRGRSTD